MRHFYQDKTQTSTSIYQFPFLFLQLFILGFVIRYRSMTLELTVVQQLKS
ncbi:unnamed protein product [Brassica oleracea]